MRKLEKKERQEIARVINAEAGAIRAIPGVIKIEPGFPIVDGRVERTPAIIVLVAHKKPVSSVLSSELIPKEIGGYKVSVMQAGAEMQLAVADPALASDVAAASKSTSTYKKIKGNPIDETAKLKTKILCHVGPDCGWPVLKDFLENTKKTLTVAMYDFNADHAVKTFVDVIKDNDLKAVLTWDDHVTKDEIKVRKKLRTTLKDQLDAWIVTCGSRKRFPTAYHEKVAVRDSKSFWLSSGNWSPRSQPDIDPVSNPDERRGMYSKANREWHIVVEDEDLSKLYEKYILYDRDISKKELEGEQLDSTPEAKRLPDVFVPRGDFLDSVEMDAPAKVFAPKALPSAAREIRVQTLLSPDNYAERIYELIKSAKKSVYLQFSYITYSDEPKDKLFTEILDYLGELTNDADKDVRIIVGSAEAAAKIRRLAEAGFDDGKIRSQGNIHNKGIIVDGETVLISSANWSGDGVLRNRDAGMIVYDKEVAQYFQEVFLFDWDNRAKSRIQDDAPAIVAKPGQRTPAGMIRMAWGDYFGE